MLRGGVAWSFIKVVPVRMPCLPLLNRPTAVVDSICCGLVVFSEKLAPVQRRCSRFAFCIFNTRGDFSNPSEIVAAAAAAAVVFAWKEQGQHW